MRIFFIYPSAESQLGFNYGVAHMAALLKRAGHQVAFWQLCEEVEPLPTERQFVERIAAERPDILAFSVVTNQWPYAQRLASWARSRFAVPFVIGGIHVLMSASRKSSGRDCSTTPFAASARTLFLNSSRACNEEKASSPCRIWRTSAMGRSTSIRLVRCPSRRTAVERLRQHGLSAVDRRQERLGRADGITRVPRLVHVLLQPRDGRSVQAGPAVQLQGSQLHPAASPSARSSTKSNIC